MRPGGLDVFPGENNAEGCSHDNTSEHCSCAPLASLAACEGRFNATPAATAFTMHDATVAAPWTSQCCLRLDGTWSPYAQPGHTSGRRAAALNVWRARVNVSRATDLRVDGVRVPLARYPNANPETDLFPAGWITTASRWLPPKPSPPIVPVNVSNAAIALRNSTENKFYAGALGGACHVFDPPFSYWCAEHPAGGGGFQCAC